MKLISLIVGFVLLIGIEILRVYYIMPFPGSQEDNTIQLAYFIHQYIIYIRIVGLLLIAYPFFTFFNRGGILVKVVLAVTFGFYAVVFYMFNFRFLADKMFLQPGTVVMAASSESTVDQRKLVLGVNLGNESKAYPIEIIGYHHQVRDIVGGEPIMVTYCTVCRTGRVFSPTVDGKPETFRLVGMDHFNAMFEDSRTGSWWRQVTGEAIAGPLKGKMLPEIKSEQMSLAAWVNLHPETKILQPDTTFNAAYKSLENYDEGTRKGRLERKDSTSWQKKSWVIGIQVGMEARAYDWYDLQKNKAISDQLGGTPLLLVAHPDSVSFQAFNRTLDNEVLVLISDGSKLFDSKTSSIWNVYGQCEEGALKGKSLTPIQSYQEYWHSWKTFHPQTTQFGVN